MSNNYLEASALFIFCRRIENFYYFFRPRLYSLCTYSQTFKTFQSMKKAFYLFPVKMLGVIVSVSVLTNIVNTFFKHGSGSTFWLLKIFILFLGLNGLFCNLSWDDLKKTSLVYKFLQTNNANNKEKL